jgi:putative SOS response-associated peptidase YedK
MCGRYRLSRCKQLIQEYFDTADQVDWESRYNIAPSQSVGIIRQDRVKPERRFSLARWGLIPHWAKDSIHARAVMYPVGVACIIQRPATRMQVTAGV